jgi:hypothetical protein
VDTKVAEKLQYLTLASTRWHAGNADAGQRQKEDARKKPKKQDCGVFLFCVVSEDTGADSGQQVARLTRVSRRFHAKGEWIKWIMDNVDVFLCTEVEDRREAQANSQVACDVSNFWCAN